MQALDLADDGTLLHVCTDSCVLILLLSHASSQEEAKWLWVCMWGDYDLAGESSLFVSFCFL